MPMGGLYYEEFTVGMRIEHVLRRTVTEADNLIFSALTHNPAALHLDEEYMKGTEFGTRIVNSGFTLALMVGISVGDTTLGTTIANLGWWRSAAAGLSYVAAQVFPRRPEHHLEDFLVNRFGKRLYEAFFKSYTEKVWGVPCTAISVDWGAQRIKGLSLTRALAHAAGEALGRQLHVGQQR